MAVICTDADVRRALNAVAVKCTDAVLLSRLATAAQQHGLAAKSLAASYSAFIINTGDEGRGDKVTVALVESFLAQLQRESSSAPKTTPSRIGLGGIGSGANRWGARSWEELGDTGLPGVKADQKQPPSTPQQQQTAPAVGATGGSPLTPRSVPRSAFKERTNSGQVVSTLNDHIPAAMAPHTMPLRPEPTGSQLPARYSFMMERPEDKVAALDARIVEGQQRLAAALGDSFGEVMAVGEPVQEDSWYVGRVVCDSEGGAPNAASLMLEGGAATSGGARAAMDLSLLQCCRLFPGQVVSVRGFNPTGARIVARRVVTHAPPPAARSLGRGTGASAMDIDGGGGGGAAAATVAVAAGPFATADDPAGYAPLDALLAALTARAAPPAMLVLLGPFVDVEQPGIGGGDLDVTFQSLYVHQVLGRVSAWQDHLPAPCQVVLLPSTRDAHAMPTFPQPPLDVPGSMEDAVCLQNPCCFDAGGALTVAATTHDVLRHLAGCELQRGPHTDRIAALASHLLGQRSFYPLYPAALGACLDTTADSALSIEQLPDLLLLPSDLAPFAKAVPAGGPYPECSAAPAGDQQQGSGGGGGTVLAVNPGRLVKGSSGGTYAVLTLPQGAATAAGGLAGNCRVDIVRV